MDLTLQNTGRAPVSLRMSKAKTKMLRIMKLTAFILLAATLHVSASGHSQQVTLSMKNASLDNVFREIRKQTGYTFVYTDRMLKDSKKVSIEFKDASLEQALNVCLDEQPLSWTIVEKTIVIQPKAEVQKEEALTSPPIDVKGRIVNESGQPVQATISIKGTQRGATTDANGNFELREVDENATLVITGVSIQPYEIKVKGRSNLATITTKTKITEGETVVVASTGYQEIPKERATGSFEVITQKQLQHNNEPNLLRRLEGITTAINFANNNIAINSTAVRPGGSLFNDAPLLSNVTIRGKNTLNLSGNLASNSSGFPLVVIDGVPRDDVRAIELVNPDDVETITILRDAASASIWGARAANGVIVIKTKRGKLNTAARISLSVSANGAEKLDLYSRKMMSVSDYIDAQVYSYPMMYTSAVANPGLTSAQQFMSPVAEILNNQRRGLITPEQATAQIDALRGQDIRRDFTKYLLRNSSTQNYNLGVSGGSEKIAYNASLGYTRMLGNTIASASDRYSGLVNLSATPVKKLSISTNLSFSMQRNEAQSTNSFINLDPRSQGNFYLQPYSRFADDQGNPAEVPWIYRPAFVSLLESTYGEKISSLRYKPLEDIHDGYFKSNFSSVNLTSQLSYEIMRGVSVNAQYGHTIGWNNIINFDDQNSLYMRDLINRFTDKNTFEKSIPIGGLYFPKNNKYQTQNLRGWVNVDKSWGKHGISGLAGFDVKQNRGLNRSDFYYGYNENDLRASTTPINLTTSFPQLYAINGGSSSARIPSLLRGYEKIIDRAYDLFMNIAYTYDNRYTISTSARHDASNAYGSTTNRSGSPFGSVGAAWTINNEKFYKLNWLPQLKLRATFGYNGNENPRVRSNPFLFYQVNQGITATDYATLASDVITNRELRPERTAMLNLGLDFGLKGSRVSGSIEYYDKRTTDLIASNAVDPTYGFETLNFNTANTHGYGIDFTLNSVNIQSKNFNWTSSFLFSYNRVKVTKIYSRVVQNVAYALQTPAYVAGYDMNSLFAYRWAGLDPQNGDPRISVDGKILSIDGNDYDDLNQAWQAPISALRYMGSAVPVFFGSLSNTFNIGAFTLSARLQYKLKYYARRTRFDLAAYSILFSRRGNNLVGAEYADRWKNAGDEIFTNVPSQRFSLSTTPSGNRDGIYENSEINTYKADHIRFQEIQVAYAFKKVNPKWFIKNPRVSANVNNLGVIWRANKLGLDPDTRDYPSPREYSIRFSVNF